MAYASPSVASTRVPARTDDEEATARARILDAATECFRQLGIAKTSLSDVARVADLSRGTVYRYFGDREGLIAAVVSAGSDRHFDEVAAVMERKPTLAKQIAAYAELTVRTSLEHESYNRLLAGDTGLMQVMLADSDAAFRRSIEFLAPYVRAAKERGEVGADVNETAAAEWLARVLMTILSTSSSASFDVRKPRTVARFVERFAVGGLTGGR